MSEKLFSERVRALESFIKDDEAAFECMEVASEIAKLETIAKTQMKLLDVYRRMLGEPEEER